MNLLLRLVMLPVIAGISYEVFKAAAKTDFKPMRALTMPGLMMQKITTQEPDDDMLEVALTALRAVVGPEASRMPVEAKAETTEAQMEPAQEDTSAKPEEATETSESVSLEDSDAEERNA